MQGRGRARLLVAGILLGCVAMFAGALAGVLSARDVVSRNVWAFGVPLSGLAEDAARQIVLGKVKEIQRSPVTFVAGNRTCQVTPDELKVLLDEGKLERELSKYIERRPPFLAYLLSRLGTKTVLSAPGQVVGKDPDKVLDRIAAALSFEGAPARYSFEGRDLVILPPVEGQRVTREDILSALTRVSGPTIEVSYARVPPPAGAPLEPLVKLAEFSTVFDERDVDRTVNLMLARDAVHGKTLLPGQVYSFNEAAGPRTEEKGYRYANVVVGDRFEPGIAGGICQVTTTLFNAAAKAGLSFPEVHAHSIPVEYVPPGYDAAVAWDYLDLKIQNNTGHPVVFGCWVEKGTVTVAVYGRPSGRTYDVESVIVKEFPEPGKNPGLLVETYQVEKAGEQVLSRNLIVRSYYLPSAPRPKP